MQGRKKNGFVIHIVSIYGLVPVIPEFMNRGEKTKTRMSKTLFHKLCRLDAMAYQSEQS